MSTTSPNPSGVVHLGLAQKTTLIGTGGHSEFGTSVDCTLTFFQMWMHICTFFPIHGHSIGTYPGSSEGLCSSHLSPHIRSFGVHSSFSLQLTYNIHTINENNTISTNSPAKPMILSTGK